MNQDAAVFLGTVAAIAFVLKSAILFHTHSRDRASQAFIAVCLFFVLQNAVEFLGYFTYLKSPALGELFVHMYLLATYFAFSSLLVFALALTHSPHFGRVKAVTYSLSLVLAIAHISGYVVNGFTFLGWSVITQPGPFYWVAMTYILLCCLMAVLHLLHHYRTGDNPETRHNARISLLAFAPIVLVATAVLMLRLAGFNSSSAVSYPIATVIFLYVMLLHTNGTLFWFSTKLKSIVAIIRLERNASLDLIIQEIEKIRIQEALKMTNGQQKTAARILGLPPSTLNKRLTKYDINVDDYKPGANLQQKLS